MSDQLVTARSSDDLAQEHLRLMFHGVPGCRKTFTALTASKYYPKEGIPSPVRVDLKDMIWWSFDNGALRGAPEMGLNVPNVFDMSHLKGHDLFAGVAQAYTGTMEILGKKEEDYWVVIDTASSLDTKLTIHWKGLIEKAAREDGKKYDKWAFLDAILASWDKFFQTTSTLPCHVIYLSHSRAVRDGDDAAAQAQSRAKHLPGLASIEIAVTGGAKDRFRRNMDIYGPIIYDRNKDASFIYPDGGRGFEGRSRFTRYLEEIEPAHLGPILEKCRKGLDLTAGS